MRFRRIAGLVTLATVCVLAFSGCNGGGSPEGTTLTGDGETTATSAAPEASATPTPTRTTNPNQAEAEAFVKRFVAAIGTMNETLDPSAMLALCTKDSEGCQASAKFTRDLKRNGGSYSGDVTPELSQFASPAEGTDTVTLQAYLDYGSYQWAAKRGEKPKSVKATQVLFQFVLTREGNEWKVKNYETVG